jgi:hypothetical protein
MAIRQEIVEKLPAPIADNGRRVWPLIGFIRRARPTKPATPRTP